MTRTPRSRRALPLLGIGLLLAVVDLGVGTDTAAAQNSSSSGGTGDVWGEASDSSVIIGARSDLRQTRPGGQSPAVEYRRLPVGLCTTDSPFQAVELCVDQPAEVTITPTCTEGVVALDPLFRRALGTTGTPTGEWEQIDNGGCPDQALEVVTITASDFRRLPLAASVPSLQPADGRGLVNVDLIVYTDAQPQTLTTTVLGVPVTVRATPVEYSWDFGDGTPLLVTTDAGRPYPDHTVSQPYTRPGTYDLTLATTWHGEYQITGTGPWYPIPGTAHTTTEPLTTHATEARSQLVHDPLP